MADQNNLEYSYTIMDKIYRLALGETFDFSGAMYDDDYSMTLKEAQRNKHRYICDNLNIGPTSRVLDMGCGWGGFLKYLDETGATGTGVTLSSAQVQACRRNGLDVHLMDCRTVKPETFGIFDAVVCIGVMEAFCSKVEWRVGRQEEIYTGFFKTVADLLPDSGKFYMQTETLGRNMIDPGDVDIDAEKGSDAHICALMEKHYPGHWLPAGNDQIIECAKPYFSLEAVSNGRLDLIETQNQWHKSFTSFNARKYIYYLALLPACLTNRTFRERLSSFWINANKIGLERELIDQYRFVFKKRENGK